MADDGLPIERLRDYLRELNPQAQAMLVRAIERGSLRRDGIPGADLILEALRPSLRRTGPSRIGNPARVFFRTFEPFLVDSQAAAALPGRIARDSLGPLWEWIIRDLAADAAPAYEQSVSAALLASDSDAAEALARKFRVVVAQAIGEALEAAAGNARLRRRIVAQIALPRAAENLQTVHTVLRHAEQLERFASRLPRSIGNLAGDQLDNVAKLVRQHSGGAPDLLLALLLLTMRRLHARWQLVRLAIRTAETDVAASVAQSPLALAGTLVFAELRCLVQELRSDLRAGQIATAIDLCKELHDAIRPLRTELDFSEDSPWARELASLRVDISAALEAEIEGAPGRLRRLIRPRPAREIEPGAVLDATDVADAEAHIKLVNACRRYAGELAVNELAPRVLADMRDYFEAGSPALLESLRGAGSADRRFRQSQVDAAVRLSGALFGNDYSALFAKAAAMAAADRKTARA
jgi:hypothetical protein